MQAEQMKFDFHNTLIGRRDEIRGGSTSAIKTGLVVQGGGMRGVYSMAALMALEEVGLGNAFDHIIGSSAGAINGSYFAAGQAKMAVGVYIDDLSNRRFVNFLRRHNIVDINYLVDGVLKKHKALDVAQVRNAMSTLHIILTDYMDATAREFTNRDADVDIMELIRATSAMPVLYRTPVTIQGRRYIDGGVANKLPLQRAIDLGCTDIVVVATRPAGHRSRPLTLSRLAMRFFLGGFPEKIRNRLTTQDELFNQAMNLIESRRDSNDTPRICYVCPSDPARIVSRTCSNRDALLQCALMARNDMRRALALPPLDDNPFG